MITEVPSRRGRRVALAMTFGLALVGVLALFAGGDAAPSKLCMSCKVKSIFQAEHRDSMEEATPFSRLIELPEGCKLQMGLMTSLVNKAVDTAISRGPWPTPPSPQRERKPVLALTGTSLVVYNKSMIHVEVGHIEIGTCWIPGPNGNRILPDFIAVHITNMKIQIQMQYYMEQEIFGFGSHIIGGGTISSTVVGAMFLNHISISDFNNTIRSCSGMLASVETKLTGLLSVEEYPEDPQIDDELIHDICYGPAYWDYAFGPRPIGMVEEVNHEIRRRFWEGYVAPPPSPPPPFWCGCGWTAKYACPHSRPAATAVSFAIDDGSACFYFCCARHHFHEALDAYQGDAPPELEADYLATQDALAAAAAPDGGSYS
mmetsp:Transcript_772/g.2378  ORF Transcript_772/g.2378 Transcript_772/m.2378 type:complete len:373 (-) Transcript_772:246-1364(-)